MTPSFQWLYAAYNLVKKLMTIISTTTASVSAIKNSIFGWMFSGYHFGLDATPTSIKKLSKSQLSILSKYFETVKYTNELRTALSFEIAAR